MLTSTYIHIPGIGYSTERRIWELGAHNWYEYLGMKETINLTQGKKAMILPYVEESVKKLVEKDHIYFAKMLPAKEHWRALSEFGDKPAYLDIETTGCGYNDKITVIGLYDGTEMQTFIRGINLNKFPEIIRNYKAIVTFFGSGFDLPVIQRSFPDLKLDHLHVDLCFLLRRLGLSGGLKRIEDVLGIKRCPETEGLSGFDAVRLWRAYRQGSKEALELLLLYNKEDVMNMEFLLYHAISRLEGNLGYNR